MDCRLCGRSFVAGHPLERYCGDGCRREKACANTLAWSRKNIQRAQPVERPCTRCGTVFEGTNAKYQYCGDACRRDKKSEQKREEKKRRKAADPERVRLEKRTARRRRRALMKNADCDRHTAKDLSVYWLEQGFIACVLQGPDCDVVYEHMDHLTPLSRGGSHTLENLVPACGRCNMQKGSRTYDEWLVFVNEQRRAKVNGK